MTRKNYWISWNPDKEVWEVKMYEGIMAFRQFNDKREAIIYGIEVAKSNKPSQLIIKNQDGYIEEEKKYGKKLELSK